MDKPVAYEKACTGIPKWGEVRPDLAEEGRGKRDCGSAPPCYVHSCCSTFKWNEITVRKKSYKG